MEFFIDTANLNEIKQASDWGVLDGVTTNPSLVSKEGVGDFKAHVQKICSLVSGPVSVEVVSLDYDGMLREAGEYTKWAKNVVIKLPMTFDGVRACKTLSEKKVKTNVTLMFSANQALLAAKAGATYASVFLGRLDDAGHDGMQVVRDAVQIYKNYGFNTKVLAASIRHPLHVHQAALCGAHVSTVPFSVLQKLFQHPFTDKGLKAFLDDWAKLKKA